MKIAVRAFVEFMLRYGDINYGQGGGGRDAMELGSKAHRKIQKSRGGDYRAEVFLSEPFVLGEEFDIVLTLEGRADGVFTDEDGTMCIEEIKGTMTPLEFVDGENIVHWGQALCYAYIYAKQNGGFDMRVMLTYCHFETDELQSYRRDYSFAQLEEYVLDIVGRYEKWVRFKLDWQELRNSTIRDLKFPFERYRAGQLNLAKIAYKSISQGKKLFVNAPTGIGKTISTIFPAVKAMEQMELNKLFYLTAKTVTRTVANEAFVRMTDRGLRFKSITITAKDKICFKEKRDCNPDFCEYAKGHFNRVNDCIYDLIANNDAIPRETIEKYAQKYMVCPYELSLDLSLLTDAVICDYNYVFDPMVYLRRFFQSNTVGDYVFLVDEAHNLVDRAREMYSAQLSKSAFAEVKKIVPKRYKELRNIITAIGKYFAEYKTACMDEGTNYLVKDKFDDVINGFFKTFMIESEILFKAEQGLEGMDVIVNLYFEVIVYQIIAEYYDDRYVTFIDTSGRDVTIKLYCLDPSALIRDRLNKGKAAVLFSATLSPLSYYKEILGGEDTDGIVGLKSPFDVDNLCLMINPMISTRYKDREKGYAPIIENLETMVSAKSGNYIAFFPSYEFMRTVYELYGQMYPARELVMQQSSMSEEEREQFLGMFESQNMDGRLVFCVLGGIFSEGIDLQGDKLIGAAVIGVGLPKLSANQDIIKNYFNEVNGMGYEYSYMFPGMNKVLQAVGRVIRSESDRGVILLIDDRFMHGNYKALFPAHWSEYRVVKSTARMAELLEEFWEREV